MNLSGGFTLPLGLPFNFLVNLHIMGVVENVIFHHSHN